MPTSNDLCAALIVVAQERLFLPEIEPEILSVLEERELIRMVDGEWETTDAGQKAFHKLIAIEGGDDFTL